MIVKCKYCGNETGQRQLTCPSCGAALPGGAAPAASGAAPAASGAAAWTGETVSAADRAAEMASRVAVARKKAKRGWIGLALAILVMAVTITVILNWPRQGEEDPPYRGELITSYAELMDRKPHQVFTAGGYYQFVLEQIFNDEIRNITWDDIARIKYASNARAGYGLFICSLYNSWDFDRAEDFETTFRTVKIPWNPNNQKSWEIGYFIGLAEIDASGSGGIEFLTDDTLPRLRALTTRVPSNYQALKNLSSLERLEILSGDGGSLEYLDELKNLKSLTLDHTGYRNLGLLASLPVLEELNLGGNAHEWDVETIGKLKNLRKLEMRADGIKSLSALSHLGNLETLRLSKLAVKELSFLSDLPNLKSLSLRDMPYVTELDLSPLKLRELELDASRLDGLDWLGQLQTLESLSLTGAKDGGFLERLPGLRRLELVNCDVFAALDNFPELEEFSLRAPAGGGIGMDGRLDKLRRLRMENVSFSGPADIRPPNLKELYIENPALPFTPESLGHLKQIERLTVKDCPPMAEAAAFLPDMPQLTHLDLSGCGLTELAFLNRAPNLVSVNLSDNKLSALLELENLPDLKTAYIAGNPLKSRDTVERLKSRVNIEE